MQSFLDLFNAAHRGNAPPVLFSDDAVAAMQRGIFPSLGRGAWTPTDGSGDALSLFTGTAGYYRLGQLVVFWGDVTYPSTAATGPTTILGLPTFGDARPEIGSAFAAITYQDAGIPGMTLYLGEALDITFNTASGAPVVNAELSGVEVTFGGMFVLTEAGTDQI